MDCFNYEMLYVFLMITTKQRSLVESQTLKNQTQHTNMVNPPTYKGRQTQGGKEQWSYKTIRKQ